MFFVKILNLRQINCSGATCGHSRAVLANLVHVGILLHIKYFKGKHLSIFSSIFFLYVHMWISDMRFTTSCLPPVHKTMPTQAFTEMDIGRTVRKAMKKFATVIDDTQDRLSHDQIIHACSVSAPSIISIVCYVVLVGRLLCVLFFVSSM